MANKKHLSLRFLLVVFSFVLGAMIVLTIYPFNFFPPNRVQWLSNEPGLYFNGTGIAHTSRAESSSLRKAVSVELLLKERLGSKNWGPREIFSFYDGSASPSLLVGQWGGRIFIYSRFEKNEGDRWYRLFRIKERFPRGEAQLVTVTLAGGLFSYLIEYFQLFLSTRSAGLEDIFGNLIGSGLGMLVAFTVKLKY